MDANNYSPTSFVGCVDIFVTLNCKVETYIPFSNNNLHDRKGMKSSF